MQPRKCWQTHAAVPVKVKGELFGGNGYTPYHKADLYIDLNTGRKGFKAGEPYDTSDGGVYLNYPIPNMGVPSRERVFKALVELVIDALRKGQRVHVGCIGGHGRTGLVLAAVVYNLTKDKNAIQWLRDNYCSKAVESQRQVDYLVKMYGLEPVSPRFKDSKWI